MGIFDLFRGKEPCAEEETETFTNEDFVPTIKKPKKKAAYTLRIIQLNNDDDYVAVLRALEAGNQIPIVNIRSIKEKDLMNAKVAIAKIKKKVQDQKGDIVALNRDWFIAVGGFAEIQKDKFKNIPITTEYK